MMQILTFTHVNYIRTGCSAIAERPYISGTLHRLCNWIICSWTIHLSVALRTIHRFALSVDHSEPLDDCSLAPTINWWHHSLIISTTAWFIGHKLRCASDGVIINTALYSAISQQPFVCQSMMTTEMMIRLDNQSMVTTSNHPTLHHHWLIAQVCQWCVMGESFRQSKFIRGSDTRILLWEIVYLMLFCVKNKIMNNGDNCVRLIKQFREQLNDSTKQRINDVLQISLEVFVLSYKLITVHEPNVQTCTKYCNLYITN